MSGFNRPIHKFITKPTPQIEVGTQPKEVRWSLRVTRLRKKRALCPADNLGELRWEIFAQQQITIQPEETAMVSLGLGVRMTKGSCLVSLRPEIEARGALYKKGPLSGK